MAVDRPDFRQDLEGFRGLAILLVVLFHAGVSSFAGGFVGVDAFFVLSGFFITGLLAREYVATDTIDLPVFLGRRALRLLPALLVVFVATLALVTWLYAPIDRADIASSARAVALSAGNLHFASAKVDYFSHGENPLLHAWSLGVEEQFYLIWPPLFLVIALGAERIAARRGAERDAAWRWMLVGLLLVGALSLGTSLWLTRVAQPWAFFGTPTRLWEFALGGALALTTSRPTSTRAFGTVTQVAGLAAIAVAVATYDRATPYPGTAALLPALAAAAMIVGGRVAPDSVVSRALATAPLPWLGRLSYAWYLWHWPLVGVGAVLRPEIGVAGRLAWSALALALAWPTYALVERSARDGRLSRIAEARRPAAALLATAMALLVAQGALLLARRAESDPAQRRFAAARDDRVRHACWGTSVDVPLGTCAFGDTTSSTTVVLFGDSHAEHWLAAMDRLGRARGWKVVLLVKGGCPVADLPADRLRRRPRHSAECADLRDANVERIVALKPAAAILSSWDHYVPVDGEPTNAWQVEPTLWQGGLRRTYERLAAAHVPTIAIRGTPRTWFDVPACLSRRAARLPLAGDCTYDRARSLSSVASDAQTAAARGLPVRIVDMNDQICATPRCSPMRGDIVVFTDDNHLTASFTRALAPVLGARLDAALAALGARLP